MVLADGKTFREKFGPRGVIHSFFDWTLDHAYLLVPAQAYVGNFLATFKDFPSRQKAASFSLDQVMEKLETGGGSN